MYNVFLLCSHRSGQMADSDDLLTSDGLLNREHVLFDLRLCVVNPSWADCPFDIVDQSGSFHIRKRACESNICSFCISIVYSSLTFSVAIPSFLLPSCCPLPSLSFISFPSRPFHVPLFAPVPFFLLPHSLSPWPSGSRLVIHQARCGWESEGWDTTGRDVRWVEAILGLVSGHSSIILPKLPHHSSLYSSYFTIVRFTSPSFSLVLPPLFCLSTLHCTIIYTPGWLFLTSVWFTSVSLPSVVRFPLILHTASSFFYTIRLTPCLHPHYIFPFTSPPSLPEDHPLTHPPICLTLKFPK